MSDLKRDIIFWAGIMRDHAMFQVNAFTAKEMDYIQTSMHYKKYFQKILKQAEDCRDLEKEMLPDLLDMLECFIEYKKDILRGLMHCKLQMNLPPTHINHQINEAMEFKNLLMAPEKSKIDTPMELVNRIKIWAADGSGHAAALIGFTDPSETLIISETQMFKMKFDMLFIKASELEMMIMKTAACDGALTLLAEETIEWLEKFNCFIEKIKELRMKCEVLGFGTLSPIIPDHLIREHVYYISKIKSYMDEKRD